MIPDSPGPDASDFHFSPRRESRAAVGAVAGIFFQTPLRRSLVTIIFLKIVFLTVFWQAVLKHQSVHVDAADMSNRIVPVSARHAGDL